MKKLFILLLFSIGIANAYTVAQSVVFAGFPANATYTNNSSDGPDPDPCNSNMLGCMQGTPGHTKLGDATNITYPASFPPIAPLDIPDEQYSASCNGDCSKNYTTTISYDNGKTCTLSMKLSIKVKSVSVDQSHSNSISGNCTIKGGDGDDLWVVTPKY